MAHIFMPLAFLDHIFFIMNNDLDCTSNILRFGQNQVHNLYVHHGDPQTRNMTKHPNIDLETRQ